MLQDHHTEDKTWQSGTPIDRVFPIMYDCYCFLLINFNIKIIFNKIKLNKPEAIEFLVTYHYGNHCKKLDTEAMIKHLNHSFQTLLDCVLNNRVTFLLHTVFYNSKK